MLLASWPASTARSGPQKPSGGGCEGGPITVTVTADESEVLVGHDVTFTATVNGRLCEGSWNKLCPDASPSFFAYLRPPEDTTRDVCCDQIGPMEYVYAATSGGGPTGAEDDDGATVTVVGPNDSTVTGFGNPSTPMSGSATVTLAITPLKDGERVGPCVSPIVEYQSLKWDANEGEFVQQHNGWISGGGVSWDTSLQRIVHLYEVSCSGINSVAVGETGVPRKYYYRIVYETQCGETDWTFNFGPLAFEPERTGDCEFKLNQIDDR